MFTNRQTNKQTDNEIYRRRSTGLANRPANNNCHFNAIPNSSYYRCDSSGKSERTEEGGGRGDTLPAMSLVLIPLVVRNVTSWEWVEGRMCTHPIYYYHDFCLPFLRTGWFCFGKLPHVLKTFVCEWHGKEGCGWWSHGLLGKILARGLNFNSSRALYGKLSGFEAPGCISTRSRVIVFANKRTDRQQVLSSPIHWPL